MSNKILIVCGGAGYQLLGQRRALGVAAELHVDVTAEIKANSSDDRSFSVRLDGQVISFDQLAADVKRCLEQSTGSRHSDYTETAITHLTAQRHARFLLDYYPVKGRLQDAIVLSPAVGGAAMHAGDNLRALKTQLTRMCESAGRMLGPSDSLDVWIISSTAGGVGEGVHRFVAASLAETAKSYWTSLRLNFVRLGPLTYTSVDQRKTQINTFFGVAADAAFELKSRSDYPEISCNWFYVDLPDVGHGSVATEKRGEMVATAVKAIMLDDLTTDVAKLFIRSRGLPMIVVRVGYRGKEFGDDLKYYATLCGLYRELGDLLEPEARKTYVQGNPRPVFKGSTDLEKAVARVTDARYLAEKLRAKSWAVPQSRSGGQGSRLPIANEEMIDDWKRSLDLLIAPYAIGDLGIQYMTTESVLVDGRERMDERPLHVPQMAEDSHYDRQWLQGIRAMQRVQAWCDELLHDSGSAKGLMARLLKLAQTCSNALYSFSAILGSTESQARNLAKNLGNLLVTLEQVHHLMALDERVTRQLIAQLARVRELHRRVREQIDIAKTTVTANAALPIKVADLYQPIDPRTPDSWLCMLDRAMKESREDIFRQQVLRGATGLTRAGLADLLEERSMNVDQIKNRLEARWGWTYDPLGRELETPWWQSCQPPNDALCYKYCILPRLDSDLQKALEAGSQQTRYICADYGLIGLQVLTLDAVSLNKSPGPDTVSAPVYLLRCLTPVVQKALANWKDVPQKNQPCGQLEIACAGVIGEPLYLNALKEVGLKDDEIDKIGQFYRFYEE